MIIYRVARKRLLTAQERHLRADRYCRRGFHHVFKDRCVDCDREIVLKRAWSA